MNSDKLAPNDLMCLTPKSFDKIRALLSVEGEALVIIQQYGLITGIDVAIWQLTDDKTVQKTVLATGPVNRSPQFNSLRNVEISDNQAIPRSARIELALATSEQQLEPTCQKSSLEWVVDNFSVVDMSEFRKVKGIADSIAAGCESVLGVDSSVWILYQHDGNLRCVSKSWEGQVEFEKYWFKMNQILRIAGVFKLPVKSM